LAIDYVQMAMFGEFDVGVIMSTDTDLRPALEAVMDLRLQRGPVWGPSVRWPPGPSPAVTARDSVSLPSTYGATGWMRPTPCQVQTLPTTTWDQMASRTREAVCRRG
jgi:hypothetical protein